MTIALLTANINSIDQVYPLVKQTVDYEYHCYTENTLPFPLPELSPRMKGKYFKTQAHKFIKADVFIWIDGSIDVHNPHFIEDIVAALEGRDVVITKHPQRDNVYKELSYIIEKMKEGDRYLLKRYIKQPLWQEYDFYKAEGLPFEYPLYQCSFFAYRPTEHMQAMFNDWWDYILRYSNFDQSQFSYVAWKHGAKIGLVDGEKYFIREKHNNYNE